jgi:hypothetical protein
MSVQVSTEFLLLGLMAEEPASKKGFYGSGITIDSARAAVDALQDRSRQAEGRSFSVPNQELPFSRDSKRVFETAAAVSKEISSWRYLVPNWHFQCMCQLSFLCAGVEEAES